MILQALHADKRLKEFGKQGRIEHAIATFLSGSPKLSWKSDAASFKYFVH
jgi:predicted RNA-binding protein YlqC (UPF0109 family)